VKCPICQHDMNETTEEVRKDSKGRVMRKKFGCTYCVHTEYGSEYHQGEPTPEKKEPKRPSGGMKPVEGKTEGGSGGKSRPWKWASPPKDERKRK